jgi:mono/diheme cytochrome c family protein
MAGTGTPGSITLAQAADDGSAKNSGAITPEVRAQANGIYDSRCSACHGPEGRGDGPGAAALHPKPINFHNVNWQKSVSDEQIAKAIVEGGSAVGLSNQMAPNPDLEDEPLVVKALVAHVRQFGK